jgi:hypothetical protein
MAKFKITATAKTVYQLDTLKAFKMTVIKNIDGSFSAEKNFDNRGDALAHLINCAELQYGYFEDPREDHIRPHIEEIEKYGSLTIGDLTATIEKI